MVYAYTKAYINYFMPNTINPLKQIETLHLPHLKCQLKLFYLLLKYHDIELHNQFMKFEIEPEAFVTGWILTNFTWIVDFCFLYELMDIIIHERDHMLILFMSVAILRIYRSEIIA